MSVFKCTLGADYNSTNGANVTNALGTLMSSIFDGSFATTVGNLRELGYILFSAPGSGSKTIGYGTGGALGPDDAGWYFDLSGSSFSANFTGGQYGDRLIGGEADDQLHGLGGNDFFKGERGADTIEGGFGNDTLDGGYGTDTNAH